MSGLYGVVSTKAIGAGGYNGLSVWNRNYGDLKEQVHSEDNLLLGIWPERLRGTETEEDRFLFETSKNTGAFDAFVFSDRGSAPSDALFLSEIISSKGIEGVKGVNGEFAGAVWDKESSELLLFRDHMGVRPLFYYQDSERVIFSTDIRGITSVKDIDASPDEDWLYVTFCGEMLMTPDSTEYQNIKCVPSGGYIRFKFGDGKITCTKGHYWIPGQKKVRFGSRREYEKELRRLVTDAVSIRANATKMGVGAELSGGLDSGVIDLLLAGIRKDCVYYSWTPDEKFLPLAEKDERLVINDICEKAGISCNYGGLGFKLNGDELIDSRFPAPFDGKYKNMPFREKYAFPNYVNTENIYGTSAFMKKKGVKFVFMGHGGDEGISHRGNPYELFYHHEYYRYLRLMFSRSSVSKHRIFKTLELIKENMAYAKRELLVPIVTGECENPVVRPEFKEKFKGHDFPIFYFAFDPQRYVLNGGGRNRLHVVAFFASCTGVRYLAPYVDYRVVDFALGIPRYLYFNWYHNRYIFREAFKDIMPESLYRLNCKENNSRNSLPPKEASLENKPSDEELVDIRKSYLDWIDRDYWGDFLDFDVINDWVYGRTDEKYRSTIEEALSQCIQLENMVRRSREVDL